MREISMADKPAEITLLLRQWREGDRKAEARLFELFLPELRRMAARFFRGERPGHTLQPTALLNEVYIRLARTETLELQDRAHFFAVAGRIMRHVLIDHARARPDFQFLSMEDFPAGIAGTRSQLDVTITIDRLLEKLEKEDPLKRNIVEMRFFLGLTEDETATILKVPLRTLQRQWLSARHWLFEQMAANHEE